jgi:hypothetical protein
MNINTKSICGLESIDWPLRYFIFILFFLSLFEKFYEQN